jgi:hydroxyethylthiazole kinase-like uncharacterized protein yjeF
MNYILPNLPKRSPSGHKGTFGTILIIGGHQAKTDVAFGGAALAGLAALRVGVGQCIFAMPDSVLHDAITIAPQATGFTLSSSNLDALVDSIRSNVNCVLVGPALGHGAMQTKVLQAVLRCGKPIVLDADALNIIARQPPIFQAAKSIITPHPVEFQRLLDAYDITEKDKDKAADALASKMKTVIVLKNSRTYISDGITRYVVEKPNAALAAAGTGDVLSGIIAGLVTQFYPSALSLFDSAVLGVLIHSKSGEIWAKRNGYRGILLTELIKLIPEAQESL